MRGILITNSMGEKIRVGLFGGSFNPLHYGHLRAAEEVKDIVNLDRIIFIPSSVHPVKKDKNIIDPKHRLKMIRLATDDNEFFEVSDVEMKRPGPSYTIDTLKYYREKHKDYETYFILGTENLARIDTWKDYKELFNYSNFAVIYRPGFNFNRIEEIIPSSLSKQFRLYGDTEEMVIYRHKSGNSLIFFKIRGIKISSTTVRNLVKKGKSIKYFVPESLNKYILKQNLYKGA